MLPSSPLVVRIAYHARHFGLVSAQLQRADKVIVAARKRPAWSKADNAEFLVKADALGFDRGLVLANVPAVMAP